MQKNFHLGENNMAGYCPICGSPEFKILGKSKTNSISEKFINKEYRVVKCKDCCAYFVVPQIEFTVNQWAELYNSEYFSSQSNWLIKQRAKELKQRFDKAESFLHGNENIKFLDIGTGEGKTLLEGSLRGWDVTGIDIVDNRIDTARNSKIKFISAKFLEYNFHENHFDFIYLDSVLEHVLDPVEYLIKIRKILKPGGVVYVGVPNEDSLFNDIRKIIFKVIGRNEITEKIKPFDSPYHVIGFNFSSLNSILKKQNFGIKYFRNFGRKFDFLSSSPNKKKFWISLFFLLPIEFAGYIIKRDVYFEAYLTKEKY